VDHVFLINIKRSTLGTMDLLTKDTL